jgi:arylsulfatase
MSTHLGPDRPNILFITTDEHRFDAIGKKNSTLHTPNLNRLADESVYFNRAYTTNPSCVPARAALFTGRYPSQCGAPTFVTYVNDCETTFMSMLQDSGYYTAAIGKQHFGQSSIRQGYDYAEINDLNSPPEFITEAGASQSYVKFLYEAGFRGNHELFRPTSPYSYEWTADIKYHLDHFIGERAKDWLANNRPEAQPWFFWLSFPGPHPPFDCANTTYAERYPLENVVMPHSYPPDLDHKPPHYRSKTEKLSDEEIRAMRQAYYANVSLIDDKIGEIVQILKNLGQYDNTLIVFTSDHGDFLGDYGLGKKGQYLSEVLMRVILMLKPPIPSFKGHEEQAFAFNFDIAATCLQAAGIEIPANMSSRSLNPYWNRLLDRKDRDFAYMEASDLRAIRTERWKLIHYGNRPYGEFYNLEQDPWERNNLWNDAEHAPVKLELYRLLADQFIRNGEKSGTKWSHNSFPI